MEQEFTEKFGPVHECWSPPVLFGEEGLRFSVKRGESGEVGICHVLLFKNEIHLFHDLLRPDALSTKQGSQVTDGEDIKLDL